MPGTFPSPWISDPGMRHGTCVTHVPWCMPGSLISAFLWSRCRGKRSQHFRHMRNPQFYVSGKRPIEGHVSYPNGSPNVSRLGLCSSLYICRKATDVTFWPWGHSATSINPTSSTQHSSSQRDVYDSHVNENKVDDSGCEAPRMYKTTATKVSFSIAKQKGNQDIFAQKEFWKQICKQTF